MLEMRATLWDMACDAYTSMSDVTILLVWPLQGKMVVMEPLGGDSGSSGSCKSC
jgi:hypothetical protein